MLFRSDILEAMMTNKPIPEALRGVGGETSTVVAPTTESKARLEELEAKKKTKGLSPAEIAEMNKLRNQSSEIDSVLNQKEQESKKCNQ